MTVEEMRYYSKKGILSRVMQVPKKEKTFLWVPILATDEKAGMVELYWYGTDKQLSTFPLCTVEEFKRKFREMPPHFCSVLFVGMAADWQMPEERNVKYADMNRCLKGYCQTGPRRQVAYVTLPDCAEKPKEERRGTRKILPLLEASGNFHPLAYSTTTDDFYQHSRHIRLYNEIVY